MSERVPPMRDWDEARAARVIESHRAYLLNIARNKLGRDSIGLHTASDVVQEALLAATVAQSRGQGPKHGDPDQDFRSWLKVILNNKIFEVFRHIQTRKEGGGKPLDPLPPDLADEGTSPSRRAIKNEEIDRLDEALHALSSTDLKLVTWSIKDGLTRREIGERLGVSATYASRICSAAEQRLRDAYRATRRDEGGSL